MGWEEKTNEVMKKVMAEPSPGNFPKLRCKFYLNQSSHSGIGFSIIYKKQHGIGL